MTFITKISWIKYLKFYDFTCSVFNSAFVANVVSFVFKSELCTRWEISDLLTDPFSFIFASNISFVNLL